MHDAGRWLGGGMVPLDAGAGARAGGNEPVVAGRVLAGRELHLHAELQVQPAAAARRHHGGGTVPAAQLRIQGRVDGRRRGGKADGRGGGWTVAIWISCPGPAVQLVGGADDLDPLAVAPSPSASSGPVLSTVSVLPLKSRMRVATLPLSRDHLKVALPSAPASWISTR